MIIFFLWVKKYWQWLVALLVPIAGFLVGVSVRKRPIIVKGDDPERKKLEEKVSAEEQQAAGEAEEQKVEAQEEHDTIVMRVLTTEEQQTKDVASDVDKTNDYLQNVSKSIRGDQ